jgi:predicted ribosomally synthesized peptide with nif11-like leader
MALDQLKAFLIKMQDDEGLKSTVLSASTADDVAKIAAKLGYEFSGDELLRQSGKKVGRVTVSKQETPGEYNYLSVELMHLFILSALYRC